MTKTRSGRRKREKEIDKDTVVAYHDFIQGRIQGELNGLSIGPGRLLVKVATGLFVFGTILMIVGILVITLRHRHVYLWDWNAQFLGPFFIIMFLLCFSAATFLLVLARRRTNMYRESLAFRPIGDYGVAVVHKSQLTYDEQKKSDLKSGTTPHNVRHPGRPGVNDRGTRGDYSRSGYDSRGYRSDDNGRRGYGEKRDRGYDSKDYGDRRDRREREDRRDRDDRRGPRPDRPDRRRPPDDRRRREDDDRRRREDDKRREAEGQRGRRGDPDRDRRRTPEEERRRAEARKRYEEDRRRAQLRKQAEAAMSGSQSPSGDERGIDVDGSKTIQVTTTVTLQHQGKDESEL